MGTRLDEGRYEHGRSGWELFAGDMGRVYNGHLVRFVFVNVFMYCIGVGYGLALFGAVSFLGGAVCCSNLRRFGTCA